MALIQNYRDLRIWQAGRELVKEIYEFTAMFPRSEQYGLTAQMRRAAISIPSNIAEGFVRRSNKEYRQFLYFALGSCAELDTQAILAFDLGCAPKATNQALFHEHIDHLSRMLQSLINRLLKKAHLRRCPPPPLPAAYPKVRLSRASAGALHLGLFEQPATKLILSTVC